MVRFQIFPSPFTMELLISHFIAELACCLQLWTWWVGWPLSVWRRHLFPARHSGNDYYGAWPNLSWTSVVNLSCCSSFNQAFGRLTSNSHNFPTSFLSFLTCSLCFGIGNLCLSRCDRAAWLRAWKLSCPPWNDLMWDFSEVSCHGWLS